MKKILLYLIRFYRKYLSPMKVYTHCIYIPTCSEYALEAIEKYGAFKGGLLTVWRILRWDGNVYGGKVMTGILMTQVSTPIIGQAAWLLGKIMDGIYRVMDLIGIHNLGVCIILLTIVIYTLLMPLTIKQQKFSKMSAAMNPELQKVQQKYKGKNDQASMQKM